MQAFKAWIQDKKNMPIVLAGTGIVLVLAILMILKMNGFIGGTKQAAMPQPGMPGAPMPGQPGMPAEPGMSPAPGAPTGDMTQPGAAPPVPGAPPAPTTPGIETQQAALAPMLPYRKDPFMPLQGMPKTSDMLAALLPSLSRPRLAPAPVSENAGIATAEEVLPPQPFRRMSGVLWNGKVSAILETNGETDVVIPGKELTRGNSRVRVESINQDSVILKTLDTKTPFTIRVTMAGSVAGGAPGGLVQQPVYGGPGPTIYPGGPQYGGEPPPPGQ